MYAKKKLNNLYKHNLNLNIPVWHNSILKSCKNILYDDDKQ